MAQQVQDCHWSVPTLLMPRPYWLSAWDAPWSCWNEREMKVLATTDACQNCPGWRERVMEPASGRDVPPAGAVPAETEH
jgi:hypothetical protein